MDWVEELRRASLDWRPPLTPLEWLGVEAQAAGLPPDLRLLYAASNGVRLPEGLRLYPLSGGPGEPSTLGHARESDGRPAAAGMWRFGRVREHVSLFAVQKRQIRGRADGSPPPDWMAAVGADDWVYGIRNEDNLRTRLFPSLARMLEALLPQRLRFAEPAPIPAIPAPQSVEIDLSSSDSLEVPLDIAVEIVEMPPAKAKRKRKPTKRRTPAKKRRAKPRSKKGKRRTRR
jgi:hypothetical protein